MNPVYRMSVKRNSCEILQSIKRYTNTTSNIIRNSVILSPENTVNTKYQHKSSPSATIHTNYVREFSTKAKVTSLTYASKDDTEEFLSVFPDIVRDVTSAEEYSDVPSVTKRIARVLHHNVPTGKKNRGLAVVFAYKLLERPENLTPENIRLAQVLGWSIEMLQAFFLVIDDIMDGSETRRGVPCWYRNPDIGLAAMNDGILIENSIYALLRRHLRSHPCYLEIIHLIHDVTLKTSMGQALDAMSMKGDKPNLNVFTMDTYNAIVKYKAAYYTFIMPVVMAMYLANNTNLDQHRQAATILLDIGKFFQIQDDYLDVFGDPKVTGKVGTDIQEGKCSWFAVTTMEIANKEQKRIMEEHYGKESSTSVEIIKNLYRDLNLEKVYANYEEESFNRIRSRIEQVSNKGLPSELFLTLVKKIYRRDA